VPEDVRALVNAQKADIVSGEQKVFTGPIKDQSGAVKVKQGETMSDDDIWSMGWFVEGVIGEIPK
ncbi:MAG: BMP family ABC transporter substrate-binding protein, partial [Synergistaceae bacterium]|nr:BMP family ABC transporter substrate-binding protein [Synergistaceae bacterium]